MNQNMKQPIQLIENTPENKYLVAALYHFVSIINAERLRSTVWVLCAQNQVKGTLLLASEGINGTIAGPERGIKNVLAGLRKIPEFTLLEHKESWADEQPFLRLKVRLKREIVTMGVEDVDPLKTVGTYVDPQEWNALIDDPDTIVIDTRNDYEINIGTFKNAVNPNTDSFRQFPVWVKANQVKLKSKSKIAMFCTGGIRCEKATAFMKQQGFDNVFHLKGGILKYLEDIPHTKSLWYGECFVFDQRVSVGHGLEQGQHNLCFGCRMPLAPEDLRRSEYEAGVHCHHCADRRTDKEHSRARERHKQVLLAKTRQVNHLGSQFD